MIPILLVFLITPAHALKKEPIPLLQLKTECSEITLAIDRDQAAQQRPATTAAEIAWISDVAYGRAFASTDGGDERPLKTWNALLERLETESKSPGVRAWLGSEGAKLADSIFKTYADPRTHNWAAGNPADRSFEQKLQVILKKRGVILSEHGGCNYKED
jgi:hypothetical protein